MRIVFCDDDSLILEQLQRYVAEYFAGMNAPCPALSIYTSGEALLQSDAAADIAFLDVEMPGVSGFEAGLWLKEKNPRVKIIVVTSYPDYLDEAMRFQVFRYLSKPVDKARLFRNLKEALYQYSTETREYAVETSDGLVRKLAEELVCVEAWQKRTRVFTTDGVLASTKSIEYWKQQLTLPCFYAPHRSFLINMRYVSRIEKDTILLKYAGQEKLAWLTKRKYKEFKDTYLVYLESVQ